jgi:hypothetical protein
MSFETLVVSLVQLVSTVAGVYLAARAAHKNTLEFETIRSERDGYFMRAALLDELKDNLNAVDAWSKEFQEHLDKDPAIQAHLAELEESVDPEIVRDGGQPWVAWWKAGTAFRHTYQHDNPRQLELSSFIWDTLKQQNGTFQLPSGLLSAVRRYYRQTGTNMRDVSTRDHLERTQHAAVAIWEDTRHMRGEVLPGFEKTLVKMRARLVAKGVSLDG